MSPERLKVQNGREGGYRETNTHTQSTQTRLNTHTHTHTQAHTHTSSHTHSHKDTLFPRLLPPPNLRTPSPCVPSPGTHRHTAWSVLTCLLPQHTRPAPLHMPTRPPTQPHTLLFLPAGKELDSFCLEMTHWASRERLQLGTDPEGWRARAPG